MRMCYAFRRGTFYPFNGSDRWQVPTGDARAKYLKQVHDIGFDGIELGLDAFGGVETSQSQVMELAKELESGGVPCVAIRAGGGLCQQNVAARNRRILEKAVEVASWIGAEVVNTALGTPPRNAQLDTGPTGAPESHGSSQMATQADYVNTADVLREVGEVAGSSGVNITIEVHQHSIADNSRSTLHLLELTDSPNVFANPDLGNVLWNYDVPEETSEECIAALASRSKYWHCKNLHRVHVPEIDHSYYVRVPLPEGDIDYRFAISAMAEAGYDGYFAIEGATLGDQLYKDKISFDYAKGIMGELGV